MQAFLKTFCSKKHAVIKKSAMKSQTIQRIIAPINYGAFKLKKKQFANENHDCLTAALTAKKLLQ